jgi:hypothetical protein
MYIQGATIKTTVNKLFTGRTNGLVRLIFQEKTISLRYKINIRLSWQSGLASVFFFDRSFNLHLNSGFNTKRN